MQSAVRVRDYVLVLHLLHLSTWECPILVPAVVTNSGSSNSLVTL